MAEQPVIIKKIIKKGHAGHHGGAWKLAYADFVTAMMAFFLLMWLLATTDEQTRAGISEYFQDPYKATLINNGQTPSLKEITPADIDKQAEKKDQIQLEKLKKKIQDMIDENPELSKVKEQIKLDTTPEGLRIQIVDNKNLPMFKSASSKPELQIQLILKALAPVINQLPNKISINGHTDARPFPANGSGYSNWELSSDRANAARYELNQGGLEEEKILRVTGLSDSIPYNPGDAQDPMNRRISIIVMNKKTEQLIFQEMSNKPATTVNNTAPPNKPSNNEITPPPDKHE
ncbi:MAG: flagellar motor protein MotB [Methylobacter sp.]